MTNNSVEYSSKGLSLVQPSMRGAMRNLIMRIEIRYVLTLLVAMVSFLGGLAKDYAPEDLVNPNLADRRVYVSDPENLMGGAAKQEVNRMLYDLRMKTGIEVGVAVVPSIGDMPIEDFSEKVFTKWGIGKADKDNGVLIVIVPEQRMARIQTGYGAEGPLPDISAKRIINKSIVPHMQEDDLDGAVVAAASDVVAVMSDPAVAEELKSNKGEAWDEIDTPITGEDIMAFALGVAIMGFLAAVALYIYDSRKIRKLDRYQQALGWHNKKHSYLALALLSLGLGFIPYLLMNRKYKKLRNAPMKCPTCGGKMKKFNEVEDNKYLSPSQDLEERLNTVDYDVWECEDCGTIERFPFKINQSQYQECPNCHTIAMALVRDHTLVPATTKHTGVQEKIYECKYCHNRTKRHTQIPKKDDGTAAALAAGAILGSMSGGRGRGGGFGGGFGGGSTGGGGASGRW